MRKINCSPFTAGERYCHPAREGGGVSRRELGRELQKEKEWLFVDSSPFHHSNSTLTA